VSNSPMRSCILSIRDLNEAQLLTLRMSIGGVVRAGWYYFPSSLNRDAVEDICIEEGIDVSSLGEVDVNPAVI
jgi:hypothetical protein